MKNITLAELNQEIKNQLGFKLGNRDLTNLMEDIEIAFEDKSKMIFVTDGYEDHELNLEFIYENKKNTYKFELTVENIEVVGTKAIDFINERVKKDLEGTGNVDKILSCRVENGNTIFEIESGFVNPLTVADYFTKFINRRKRFIVSRNEVVVAPVVETGINTIVIQRIFDKAPKVVTVVTKSFGKETRHKGKAILESNNLINLEDVTITRPNGATEHYNRYSIPINFIYDVIEE